MPLITKSFFLSRAKMSLFLGELKKITDPDAVSIYLPPGATVPEIEELLARIKLKPYPDGLNEAITGSKRGTVLFWGEERKSLILPPLPFTKKTFLEGYVPEPLQELVESDTKIGLILVHLGSYAVGICQGERLISSKVGTGLIHGRHKKGGSSQQRFQRRRQNQVQEFLDRVCGRVREQFGPQVNGLDYVVYGGPHQTILQLQKRCPFLESLSDRVLPLMDVPALRQKVLESAASRLWSSHITEWQEART